MKLDNVVPWGRNLQEYRAMGLYTEKDKDKKILGCGDGPASINFELTQLGVNLTSVDPVYQFTKEQIQKRIDLTSSLISEQVYEHKNDFVWKNIADVDTLISLRLDAMSLFLNDYDSGKAGGRYRYEELPALSFEDKEFDVAWSSHFLFLYSEYFDLEFHKKAILEMLRVSKEVRIFPLLDLKNERSVHLKNIVSFLEKHGYSCEIQKSEYEFQKGGDEMLRIFQ